MTVKRNKNLKKLLAATLAAITVLTLPIGAFADTQDIIDTSKRASLTVYKYDEVAARAAGVDLAGFTANGERDAAAEAALAKYAIKNVGFTYLKVGNINTESKAGKVQLKYDIPAKLETILGLSNADHRYTSDEINKAAFTALADNTATKNKLEEYIKTNSGNKMAMTDATGMTKVSNLELGLYLVVETSVPEYVNSTVNPFFVSLPMTDATGDYWIYDVYAYPKNQSDLPTIDKLVSEDGNFADIATASQGDTLQYRIVSKLLGRKYAINNPNNDKSMLRVNFSGRERTNKMKYKNAALKYARKSYSKAAVSFDTKKVCREPTLRSKKFSFRNLLKGNALFKRLKEAVLSKVMLSSAGGVVIICILIVVLFGAGISYFGYTDSEDYKHVSIAVEEKADYIRSCAKDEEILNYEELIKAVVMVETGGENVSNAKIDAVSTKLALCIEQVKPDSPVDIGKIRQVLQRYFDGDDEEKCQEFIDSVLEYYPFARYTFAGGNGAIVEVAKGQLGNVGGRPFWSWYGFSEHVEWCACFVSWCEDKCGYLDSGKAPKFAAVGDGISWFKSKGQWKRGTITPESGMIIFFDWEGDSSPDHVGIVEKVENGTVWTIEGNSGDKCREMSYSVGSSVVYGYGVIVK